jgi:hypothetical protein
MGEFGTKKKTQNYQIAKIVIKALGAEFAQLLDKNVPEADANGDQFEEGAHLQEESVDIPEYV